MKMTILLILLIFILPLACKHNVTAPPKPQEPLEPPLSIWQALGFEDKPAWRLVLADPYLYACAFREGLWRLNLHQADSEWEYVGLADTSIGGVVDVVIDRNNHDWLLSATRNGIYRSLDGGNSWAFARKGMEYTYGADTLYFHPTRLLQYSDYILATGQGVVFKTEDFGSTWTAIDGRGGCPCLLRIEVLIHHKLFKHIAWMGGDTGLFTDYLAKSTDAGINWKKIELQQIVSQGGVTTIALDPVDPNVVYVAVSEIIKTIDGGNIWEIILRHGATAMLVDPRNSSHLWLAYGIHLSESWDAGITWQPLKGNIPITKGVIDMVWDEQKEVVYVGTDAGVYAFKQWFNSLYREGGVEK